MNNNNKESLFIMNIIKNKIKTPIKSNHQFYIPKKLVILKMTLFNNNQSKKMLKI